MTDAGNTCVAEMVSCAVAGSAARAHASAARLPAFMFSSSVVLTTRGLLPSGPVSTVFSAFERAAAAHAAKPFLEMPSWKVELTYAQALERTAGVAARYRALGYGPGHRVALQLENRPEFLLHFLALNALGVSVV